ncbi:hypothetical protein MMC07_002941 [Pseudocyphellaria aurata]|nr:hypothetical protein [Pseudocyphellaria aurata]
MPLKYPTLALAYRCRHVHQKSFAHSKSGKTKTTDRLRSGAVNGFGLDSKGQSPAAEIHGRPLPPNYNATARRVTSVIIALPIVIYTSYILYERLVLGEERKKLVPPAPSDRNREKSNGTDGSSKTEEWLAIEKFIAQEERLRESELHPDRYNTEGAPNSDNP